MIRYDNEYFERIGISNDYMFREVFRRDESRAARLLTTVLERSMPEITYLDDNHELDQALNTHGNVLDIYVRMNDGSLANVEMQDYWEKALALRMRTHLSSMDKDALSKGQKRSFTAWASSVFICTKDHVGDGRRKHTAYWTYSDTDACLLTRQEMVILYARGTWGDVTPG